MSIRTRLLLLVLIFTAPLLGALLWYANFTYRSEITTARNGLQTLSRLAVLDLERAAQGGIQLLSGLAHVPSLHGPRTPVCDALLASKFSQFPEYTGILTFDVDGNLVCAALETNRPQNFGKREYFKRGRDTGKPVIGTPIFGGLTKKAVLPILQPMKDAQGKNDGYVFASLDLARFAEQLHQKLHTTAVFAIWGPNATLMARHPALPEFTGKQATGTAMAKFMAESGESGVGEFAGLDGIERVWALSKLPSRHGSDTWITVGIAKDEALAVAQGTTRPLLIAVVLGVLVALAAAGLFVNSLVRRPVSRLQEVIKRYAAGDRSARIGAPYPTGELGELMQAADRIAAKGEADRIELEQLTDRLEQRVAERTAELEASNRELEAFCYSVSHDLRAPVRQIQGFSEVLAQDHAAAMDAGGLHCIDRVRDATIRMGSLIDDLLHLSRVTRAELRRETVDLSACATRILGEFARTEPGRKVETAVAPGMKLQGDPNLIDIAMENLLGNAWKFTSSTVEAKIEVGCHHDVEELVFWVRDNGSGFDMKYAEKLFQPFQRLHRTDEFPGTGIGLVTVHRIITRLGGRIWIEAEVSKGATAYFVLPTGKNGSAAYSAG